MRKSGKVYAKYAMALLGLSTFVAFWVLLVTRDGLMLTLCGIPLVIMIIAAGIWQITEIARQGGFSFYYAELIVDPLQDTIEAGFRCKPSHTLKDPIIPSEDKHFVQIVDKLNADEIAKDPAFAKLDPKTIFKGIDDKDMDGLEFCYSEVDKVCVDELDEEILDEEHALDVEKHDFDIRKTKVILWGVRGNFERITKPRRHNDHGIFSMFDRKMLLTKCTLILLKEVRPGILVVYMEHTVQQTYDKSFDVNAKLDPNKAIVKAALGYSSVVAKKPSHQEAEIQDLEKDRDLWQVESMRAQDEKNKWIEEHAGQQDDNPEAEQAAPVVLPPEKKYGVGIAIGFFIAIPFVLFVLQLLAANGVRLIGG